MKTLIITLLISCQAIAQYKATAIVSFGRNSGPGSTIIFHTPEGPGVYIEFQSQIWERSFDDDIRKYGDPDEAKKLFNAIRLQNQANNWDSYRQNLAFGISIPTKIKNAYLGVGLGMQKQTTRKKYSLGPEFQELSTYDAPGQEFYLESDNIIQWSLMLNTHAVYCVKRMAFKVGIAFNSVQTWTNLGVGIRL